MITSLALLTFVKMITLTQSISVEMVGIMEERKTIKMKNSVVTWHGYKNYNMNCNIEDLKKRGLSVHLIMISPLHTQIKAMFKFSLI